MPTSRENAVTTGPALRDFAVRRVLRTLALPMLMACGSHSTATPPPVVRFDPAFRFGFATVGYQSEGTLRADGTRVASNWSEWEDLDRVAGGQHNDHGNGFLLGYANDLDRAAGLGSNAFSYAIDWARLEPQAGVFDEDEVQRVVDIVTAIRARGMKPLIVLFHWVTPSWAASIHDGVDLLTQSDSAFVDAFMPLVEHIVPPLAGMVDDWVTFEEPYSIVAGEYIAGLHPPGHVLDFHAAQQALVNLMYLHAGMYRRVKDLDTEDADGDGSAAAVGFENLAFEVLPVDPGKPEDVAAAQRIDYVLNHQFLTGIWGGDIDIDFDGAAITSTTMPPERHDPALEHTLDFIGLNYYGRARADPGLLAAVAPLFATPHFDVRDYDPSLPHTDAYLEISATGLRTTIEAYSKYGVPLVITENGDPDADDEQRPYYLIDHLRELGRAIADGYDVRGYYYWTISDNFEWASGIDSREGLFQVDFSQPDLPRTRTRSADLFEAIAKRHAIDDALWRKWALPTYPVGVP